MTKLNESIIIKAFKGTGGVVSDAARKLKITRKALYVHIAKNPKVKEALEESREEMLDTAEGALFTKVKENEIRAVTFYLKHQGKDRGYSEHQRIDANITGEIAVKRLLDD